MPALFRKLGVEFQYPENWSVDEGDAIAGQSSVTVYSPGGAFWSLSIHPRSTDPSELAKAAVDAIEAEYEGVETEIAEETVGDREMAGYDLSFFYLDLTSTATVRCLRTDRATYAVFCQAEDREYEKTRAVFQAMTASFVSHLGPPARFA